MLKLDVDLNVFTAILEKLKPLNNSYKWQIFFAIQIFW